MSLLPQHDPIPTPRGMRKLVEASSTAPTLEQIRACRAQIASYVHKTPVVPAPPRLWKGSTLPDAQLKLELFQRAGSFKPRGALAVMLELDPASLERGVTAVSAGNHALAVTYAASVLSSHAKVVMPKNANPARVAACRDGGAEVVLVADVHAAFEEVRRIEREEGRHFVHPFDGPRTTLGTATLGLELCEQVPDLDAVVVPIGGGGLCAGVASAVKAFAEEEGREIQVFGVEPEGADTMHRSFDAGSPQGIDKVRTIADSLGAPHAAQHSFELCRQHVDELVLIRDHHLREAMVLLFQEAKLAVEPAGAATTAALRGPLRDQLAGKKVGLIVCGANIDVPTFWELVQPAL